MEYIEHQENLSGVSLEKSFIETNTVKQYIPRPYDRRVRWTLHFYNGGQPSGELVCGSQLPQGSVGELPHEPLPMGRMSLVFILIHQFSYNLLALTEAVVSHLSKDNFIRY